MARLQIILQDRWGELVTLCYEIYQHDLAERWLCLTQQQLESQPTLSQVFHNRTQQELDQCAEQLAQVVEAINEISPNRLMAAQGLQMDQDRLNYLHMQFEKFEELESLGQNPDPRLSPLWHQLNTHIHVYESARSITATGPGSFNLLYDINAGSQYLEISAEHRLWAEPNLQWGGLYLGYSTVGKDWLATYLDDDRDLMLKGAVKPQQRFSAETWLCFNNGQPRYNRILEFQQWYHSLDPDLQALVPVNDLTELSLGKFRIGDLIIDQQFLDIDPDAWHWQAQGHPCRQLWNHVVFRSLRSIKEIKILA